MALMCRESGEQVRALALVNNEPERDNHDALKNAGVDVIVGSITDRAIVDKAVEGIDIVYHLAAAQHEAEMPDKHFRDVNVEGTRTLLDASIDAGVKRFIHGSSIGVYGMGTDKEIDEETPSSPGNIYGVTKSEGEDLAKSYCDRLPVVIIRISETYGPGDRRRLLKLFNGIAKGVLFVIGPGENIHQMIYVDDLVEGLRLSADSDKAPGEVFVISGDEKLTTNRIFAEIAKALNVPPSRRRVPLWPFEAAAIVCETICRPIKIQPPLHRRRMDFFKKSFSYNTDKAKNVLGFEPKVDFAEGARLTANWYRENGFLAK
ncbi:MAG: NAD-dependent epimerase/dehydratase family protein [Rhodospirillales bacterium]|nr:NAD-dependent epimerase/dehydratase family protein [Rhodospirillales bacterium]